MATRKTIISFHTEQIIASRGCRPNQYRNSSTALETLLAEPEIPPIASQGSSRIYVASPVEFLCETSHITIGLGSTYCHSWKRHVSCWSAARKFAAPPLYGSSIS